MNKIEFGDCRETMRRWAAEGVKVQTCVTSPPYFGLRDYGHEGQIGLEQTPEEYIAAMVEVFRCVRDVLADDGTLWLNLGDSYWGGKGMNGSSKARATAEERGYTQSGGTVQMAKRPQDGTHDTIKPKDLIGIPWMLAFALRADGWYLRQDIIWHKPNPMPESVRDRCTKAHEYIFLLSKSEKYFFDSEAIREGDQVYTRKASPKKIADSGALPDGPGIHGGFGKDITTAGANKRSVWKVATRPYKGAHFATFPPDLIEPCVLAGSSEKGHCPECGSKWVRQVEKTKSFESGSGKSGNQIQGKQDLKASDKNSTPDIRMGPVVHTETIGWKPSCSCGHDPVPDIVLDPFIGSGTTAQVALQHGRQYLGCELNPEYKALQDERIAKAQDAVTEQTAQLSLC
jgi:DNA modification methylase